MKNKAMIIPVFIVIVVVLNIILPTIKVCAEEKNSSKVIRGTYQFSSNEGSNIQTEDTFEYRDECFTRASFLGCKHLEVLSIQAASASISWYGSEQDKDEIDPSENAHNIVEMLKKMEFANVSTNKYYTTEKHESTMGVAVGSKKIIQDGKEYTLLAIIPRSAGYKQEWAGNLVVGDGEIHEGFKSARDEILRYVKKYIEDNNINGELKVWTTGYSRGAAVSNMLGGFFAGGGIEYFGEDVTITPEDVYCYTIGTPRNIKNGASKNIELSVSGKRSESTYADDTPGEAYQYTKGGTLSVNNSMYNGIRSIISPQDAFPLLPPGAWGFTRYGKDVSADQNLTSEQAMLTELENISPYIYGEYTENGKVKKVKRKTFNLEKASIVDDSGETTPAELMQERLEGLEKIAATNNIYKDEHYQDALKALAGTYGMSATFFKNGESTDSIETGDLINAVLYTYLAYISEYLQEEGVADNENEAVAIALEDLLEYLSGEEIDRSTYNVDDFIVLFAKYIIDNEDEPIAEFIISGIINIVPDEDKQWLDMFKGFAKNEDGHEVTREEGLRAFIKACYYGADPECYYGSSYPTPKSVRTLLCVTMIFALSDDIPGIMDLFKDETDSINGEAVKFDDAVSIILTKMKNIKDDRGRVIDTYDNVSDLADDKLKDLIDKTLSDPIEQSENLYGAQYRREFSNQVDTLKNNITQGRRIISYLLFYSEEGLSSKTMIDNVATFASNAMLIPLSHYNEVYLAKARTSNRYENHSKENEDDDNESPDEEKELADDKDYAEGSNHSNNDKSNPKTGDKIVNHVYLFIISITIAAICNKLRKRNLKYKRNR